MKRVVFFVFWSAAFLSCIPGVGNTQTAVPHLVIEEPVFDAGEVKEGTRISHDFTIVNKGKATLQIQKVSPG